MTTEKVTSDDPDHPQSLKDRLNRALTRVGEYLNYQRLDNHMRIWWSLGLVWLFGTVLLICGTTDLFQNHYDTNIFATNVNEDKTKLEIVTKPNKEFKNTGLLYVGSAIFIHSSIVVYLISKLVVKCVRRSRERIRTLNTQVYEEPLPTYEDIVQQETPPPSYRATCKINTDQQHWWTSIMSLSSIFGKPPPYSETQNTEASPSLMVGTDASSGAGVEESCYHLPTTLSCSDVRSCGHLGGGSLNTSKYNMASSSNIFYTRSKVNSLISSVTSVRPKNRLFSPMTKCHMTKSSPMLFLNPQNLKSLPERKISFISSLQVVNESQPFIVDEDNRSDITEASSLDDEYAPQVIINKGQSKSSKDVSFSPNTTSLDVSTVSYTLPLKRNRLNSVITPEVHTSGLYERENLVNHEIENKAKIPTNDLAKNSSSVSVTIYEENFESIPL